MRPIRSVHPIDQIGSATDRSVGLGGVQFSNDGLGNWAAAAYPDGKADPRMPDPVGSLLRTNERRDCKYGRAGQALESWGKDGITRELAQNSHD